jgi:alanine-glyoxylate transaminase / serine-glyoxylate transaminase / serine-pyruvate transaminase
MKSLTVPLRLLLGPGPSNVPPAVLAALGQPLLGHLDPCFLALVDEVKAMLRLVFRTSNAVTFPVSGTGSAGMEAAMVNLVLPGDSVVVAVNGVFGVRLANLADRLGARTVRVESPWGRVFDRTAFLAAVASEHPRLACLVNGETSTGVYQDPEGLAERVHACGGLLLVDCVTSLAGQEIALDAWEADVAYAGTQKCLSCPPGLSPVSFSPRALEVFRARRQPVPSFYLDLGEILKYIDGAGGRAYHHTAPISMIYALHQGLSLVLEEGLEACWRRHREAAAHLIAGMEPLGFAPLVPENERLHPLTTLTLPAGLDEASLRRRLLEEEGIEIGSGLGPLAGKIWRIGLMGHNARPEHVDRLVGALARLLGRRG